MSSMKVVVASQAKCINQYKNLKRKVLNCDANIYFNKQCLSYGLTPKYADIRVPNTSRAAQYTQQKLIRIRLRDEIKFLYIRKSEYNKQLYQTHLKVANEWGMVGQNIIFNDIKNALHKELQQKYNNIHKKLSSLKATQLKSTYTGSPISFYPRVINHTAINLSTEELALLNKGLKYNLHHKPRQWITTLTLEAETAISALPPSDQDPIRYLVNKQIQHLIQNTEEKSRKCTREYRERRTLHQLRRKLEFNKATIVKADKGNSVVITYLDEYFKIQTFIDDNNFLSTNRDLTSKYKVCPKS